MVEASYAGLIPATNTMVIAMPKFCRISDGSVLKPIAGIPIMSSYIVTIAGPPKAAPSSIPMEEPMIPMAMGARTKPGMIADLGTPSGRRLAISLA